MYQFFVEENQVTGNKISILGSDVNHMKNVLRMKTGERVRISISHDAGFDGRCNHFASEDSNFTRESNGVPEGDNGSDTGCNPSNAGRSFFGIIDTIMEDEVIVTIESEDENGTELSNRIYLFQGLPKGDKMELIIQKSVELGVYEIIPVAMKNCVVKLDDKKAAGKVKRWQAISESAAKQSKRTLIPEIQKPLTWKEALKKAEELDVVLVPYENERGMDATREVMQGMKKGQSIGIFVGPEGGFSPEEIEQIAPVKKTAGQTGAVPEDTFKAKQIEMVWTECLSENGQDCGKGSCGNHVHRISLGRRILRTETAGLAILSILVFCLDE